MKNIVLLIVLGIVVYACGGDTLPKPKPYLKLSYANPSYTQIETNCPYNFEISDLAHFNKKNNCWASIDYPKLNARVHITYRLVNNNLNEILKEVEKLTFEHTVKADAINAVPFENSEKKVYAKLFNIEGNVASNVQFRITDSLNHVLAGALYFNVKPNYDSIVPAIHYIERDIVHLVETFEWKD